MIPLLKNQHRRKMMVYPLKRETKPYIYWHPMSWLLSMLTTAPASPPSFFTPSVPSGRPCHRVLWSCMSRPILTNPSWLAACCGGVINPIPFMTTKSLWCNIVYTIVYFRYSTTVMWETIGTEETRMKKVQDIWGCSKNGGFTVCQFIIFWT